MYFLWAQELLGHHFTVIHGSDWIMANIDAITCHSIPLIAKHLAIAAMIIERYQLQLPKASVT